MLIGVLNVDEAKMIGMGCSWDALPLIIAVRRVTLFFLFDSCNNLRVLWQRSGGIDGLSPGDIKFMALGAFGIDFGDPRCGVTFGLKVNF